MSDYFIKQQGQSYYIIPKTNRIEKAIEKRSVEIKGKEEYGKSSTKVIVKRYAVK